MATNEELLNDLKQFLTFLTDQVPVLEQRLKAETVTEKDLEAIKQHLLADFAKFVDRIESRGWS
jgi:hypothetical protein